MKKLLALVLALVMTLGLATVSSNAAFSDDASIEHAQAVNTLVSIGVIDGMPDGSFQPTGNVTRAQMAKMISILCLGDVSVSAFEGTTTDLTDIKGHWAEAYIKYCYSQGIISGRGNGLFDPDANVTTTEAAKMGLTAIGYNSDVQGYKGENWKINVTRDAQISGFFAELLGLTADKALTRDEAAQLLLNAADADLIQATPQWGAQDGKITYTYAPYADHRDMLNKTFKAYTFEGYFTNFSYNSTDKEWTYTLDADAIAVAETTNWTGAGFTLPAIGSTQHRPGAALGTNGPAAGGAWGATFNFPSTEDYTDMYGARVKILYGQSSNNDINKIYGMYTTKTKVVAANVMGNLPAAALTATAAAEKEIKIDGTPYSLTERADRTPVFFFTYNQNLGADVAKASVDNGRTFAAAAAEFMYQLKLMDVTGDGKGDYVMVYPAGVNKVNYVSASNFTTIAVNAVAGTFQGVAGTNKIADVDVYDGVAKDDYVLATPAANTAKNTAKFEKLTMSTGTVNAVKSTDAKIQVGGNWLSTEIMAGGTAAAPNAGDEINFVVNNGFIVYQEGAKLKGADALVVVKGAAAARTGVDNTQEIKLLAYDGTTLTGRVSKLNGAKGALAPTANVGEMYSYKIDSDGYYELISVSADMYFPKGTTTLNVANGSIPVPAADVVVSGFSQISQFATAAAANAAFVTYDNTMNGAATAPGSYTTAGGTQSASSGVAVAFAAAGAKTDATLAPYTVISDDAVVWVWNNKNTAAVGDDSYSVTTGKELKKNSANTNVMFVAGSLNSATGYVEVKAAYVQTVGLSSTKNYGFVLDDVTRVADGNKFYVTVKFWDGSSVKELRTESQATGGSVIGPAYTLSKRDIFHYELNGDGQIKSLTRIGNNDVAVAQYSGSNIHFDSRVFYKVAGNAGIGLKAATPGLDFTVSSDTKIFYVNSEVPEGVTGGSITLANQTRIDTCGEMDPAPANHYLSNAYYYDDDLNGELDLLVIDVNGNMKNVK